MSDTPKKLIVVGLLVLLGCSPGLTRRRLPSSSARFAGTSLDQAFQAATKAITGPYKIESIDRHNYVLRTAPLQYVASENTGMLADQLVPSKHTFRKIATVRVHPSVTGRTIVSVRVEVERRDTQVVQAFAYQQRSSDVPADEPVSQASPAGTERREVWTFIRRDQAEEQKLLQSIRALLKPTTK